jgi:hypothetical protein
MKGKPNFNFGNFEVVVAHMWKIKNNNKIAPSSKCSNVRLTA